jgi:hypothetical protein
MFRLKTSFRAAAGVTALLLVAGACGRDSDETSTSTTAAPAAATTLAPTTTAAPTTTVAPPTTAALATTVARTTTIFAFPPLPVSSFFGDSGPTAEPWDFDAALADCGFESKYGPTVSDCRVIDSDGGVSALILHDLGPRIVAFASCGSDVEQFPNLAGDDVYALGQWATVEELTEGATLDSAGFALIGLEGDLAQVVVTSLDASIGDGCTIAYDVGEWPANVSVAAQHGALRIEHNGERSCVIKTGPGSFTLGDPASSDTPC